MLPTSLEWPGQTPSTPMLFAASSLPGAAERYWRVGSCEYKDQEKAAAGSMRSLHPVPAGTLPPAVEAWTVRLGYEDWSEQRVAVEVLPAPPSGGYLAAQPGAAPAVAEASV